MFIVTEMRIFCRSLVYKKRLGFLAVNIALLKNVPKAFKEVGYFKQASKAKQ